MIIDLAFFFPPPSGNFFELKILSFSQNKVDSQDYFLSQNQTPKLETPSFNLIEGNSLAPFSVPFIPSGKVLATLSSEDNFQRENKEVIEYIVEPGDNLNQLSEKFGISLNTIIWANNLSKNSKLKVGQKLIILPVSGVLHYVKKGENLAQIAKIYQADIDKILDFNEISGEEIFPGDILIIPEGVMPQPKKLVSPIVSQPPQIPLASSYFIFPTPGKISQGLHWYNAIDISAPCGTPVYSAAAGRVVTSTGRGWNGGYGKYIKIQHPNGVITLYAHNSQLLVSVGENVSQGQIIARVGSTGRSTGCHLHFEVRGAKNPFAP